MAPQPAARSVATALGADGERGGGGAHGSRHYTARRCFRGTGGRGSHSLAVLVGTAPLAAALWAQGGGALVWPG
eukprot:3516632-Prymnesium_polylepis.1